MTRPDLAWSYSELSKYVQYPGQAHMDAALHVLRYLRGTYDQAILYQHVHTLVDTLWGWVDSDWAADVDSRRSHTGYIIMLNGGAVSCSTLKWALFSERSRRICNTVFTPKSTQVRAVPERGNQGQTQHKGTAAGTAYAALATRPGLLKRPRSSSRSSFFLLLLKIDGKPCFTFFFSPFSPKLGFQNLTEARIARTLTATLLSHSLWA
jgi:hypothetical protein